LDPKIGPFVFGAKEFGLDKNEGADIRPISVTEALFRLVGKSICIAYSDEWKEFFQPFQFAIATPRGIETFIHLFRNDMEIDQNVVTSIDAENAFSSIFRSAVLEQLRKHYPILVPFFLSVYGEHSNLRVHHYSGKIEWIKCDEGLLQGDPLSVFYFALATQSIHRRISEKFEVRIAAYVDDTNFISSKKKIKQVVDSYKLEYNKIGLKIKEKKSFHYDPHDQLQKSEFPITRKGFRCLGAPLGSQDYEKDFCTQTIKSKAASLTAKLIGIAKTSPQIALLIFRFSILNLGTFLARTVPLQNSMKALKDLDSLKKGFVESITGPLSEVALKQVSLRIKSGGLGLTDQSQNAPAAFLASVLSFMRTKDSYGVKQFPIPNSAVETSINLAVDWLKELKPGTKGVIPLDFEELKKKDYEKLQNKLAFMKDQSEKDSLLKKCSKQEIQRINSCSGLMAHKWLIAIPTDQNLSLKKGLFENRLKARLGISNVTNPKQKCLCKTSLANLQDWERDYHLETCKNGGGGIRRHDQIKMILYKLSKVKPFLTVLEPHGTIPGVYNERKKPDFITYNQEKRDRYYDFFCTHPFSTKSETAGSALKNRR
jgi:hypothetical protein